MFLTRKFIVKLINIDELFRSPKWWFKTHLPFVSKVITQSFYKPIHENIYYTRTIYDGMSRNDFKKGDLINFLHDVGAIKMFKQEDDDDGRGYWIGCLDDE